MASSLSNTILSWVLCACWIKFAVWPTGTREKKTPGRIWPVMGYWALWEVRRMYLLICRKCGREAVMETKAAKCERSEEHTSELQSREKLVCRLLLEKKK